MSIEFVYKSIITKYKNFYFLGSKNINDVKLNHIFKLCKNENKKLLFNFKTIISEMKKLNNEINKTILDSIVIIKKKNNVYEVKILFKTLESLDSNLYFINKKFKYYFYLFN